MLEHPVSAVSVQMQKRPFSDTECNVYPGDPFYGLVAITRFLVAN